MGVTVKTILFTLFFAIGCGQMQAQTSSGVSEQEAYQTLQILSGQTLNSNSIIRIPKDSLINLCRKIEVQARISNDWAKEFKAGQIQTNTYAQRGDIGLAANKAQQLLEKAHKTNTPLAIGLALQAVGDTYIHTERFEQADSTFNEAQSYLSQYGDQFMLLQLTLQQLHVHINLPNHEKAPKLIEKGYSILNKDSSIPDRQNYLLLLSCYETSHAIRTGDALRARQLMEEVEQARPKNGSIDLWLHNLSTQYYMLTRELEEALLHSDSAVNIALGEINRNILYNTLRLRSDLLEEMERNDEACKIYNELSAMRDSLYKAQYISQIDSLHVAYWIDHLQVSNMARRNSLYTKVTGGLFALMLITLTVIILIRRKNRKLEESRRTLAAMREATADSIRSKSLFLSNMSHELRTPLNAIVGFSIILTDNDEIDEETQQQCSSYIRQNAELLMKLIQDAVDLSNLKGDSIEFILAPCNVVALCHNVIETINNVKRTQAQLLFDTSIEHLVIVTDSNRLQQVLINLLINATKFTSGGTITLRLHVDQAHSTAVFTVEDTGCGIPVEKQARIFERFEKAQEQTQGAGLGLSICKLILDYLDGHIWIDPEYTQGARFIFTHPLHLNKKEKEA